MRDLNFFGWFLIIFIGTFNFDIHSTTLFDMYSTILCDIFAMNLFHIFMISCMIYVISKIWRSLFRFLLLFCLFEINNWILEFSISIFIYTVSLCFRLKDVWGNSCFAKCASIQWWAIMNYFLILIKFLSLIKDVFFMFMACILW